MREIKKQDNRPLISVIVPIYNVELYLKKCVESIIDQSYSNLEIILVDDGSPDNCGEICEELAKQDRRIKVIHKQNGGLSSARNAGIDASEGEYIGFVDSDDSIETSMYEKLFEAIQIDHTKLAVCAVNYVFEDGRVLHRPNLGKNCIFDFYHAIVEMNAHRYFDMGAWSKLYHRSLFDDIRFPVNKLSEDFYIMFKIFDRAQNVSYVDIPCYNYLQRKNSITHNVRINQDHEYAAKEQMLYLDEKYPDMKVVSHTAYASAALTVYDSYIKNSVPCPKEKVQHFCEIVEQNKDYIKQADHLSKSKKLQFVLFGLNRSLYNVVFRAYRVIRRV